MRLRGKISELPPPITAINSMKHAVHILPLNWIAMTMVYRRKSVCILSIDNIISGSFSIYRELIPGTIAPDEGTRLKCRNVGS